MCCLIELLIAFIKDLCAPPPPTHEYPVSKRREPPAYEYWQEQTRNLRLPKRLPNPDPTAEPSMDPYFRSEKQRPREPLPLPIRESYPPPPPEWVKKPLTGHLQM